MFLCRKKLWANVDAGGERCTVDGEVFEFVVLALRGGLLVLGLVGGNGLLLGFVRRHGCVLLWDVTRLGGIKRWVSGVDGVSVYLDGCEMKRGSWLRLWLGVRLARMVSLNDCWSCWCRLRRPRIRRRNNAGPTPRHHEIRVGVENGNGVFQTEN